MASIQGVALGTVTLTITLPSTRTDGTTNQLSEIQSLSILRNTGAGPASLVVLTNVAPTPFTASMTYVDSSPVTGSDAYSAFCTDTAGTAGATSLPVSISVAGQTLAPLSAPVMTASNTGGAASGEVITPATVTLAPGATQSFSAAPTGVTWSAVSGTIDVNGNYTAPQSGTDTVTATSTTTSTVTGTASVTVTSASQAAPVSSVAPGMGSSAVNRATGAPVPPNAPSKAL